MTPPLLEKSKQSMLIAEMLVKHHYSSTVNRAYYSCLQYILHILIEKLGHSREDLKNTPRTGTHSQAQYLLESTLVTKESGKKIDYKWFQEKLASFKQDRVIADYYGDVLDQGKGYEAINTANSIINLLKKYY